MFVEERCQSLQSWMRLRSVCPFLILCRQLHLSPVAMTCVQNRHTPPAHTFLTQYAIIVSKYFLLERMTLRPVCPFLNLYRQSHLSCRHDLCTKSTHTTCTTISQTICNPCVTLFFGEDGIDICWSFSEFM